MKTNTVHLTSKVFGPMVVGDDRPPASPPKIILWCRGGATVECASLVEAQHHASRLPGKNPGTVFGVYEMVGFAVTPLTTPEFEPVDRESEALALPAPSEADGVA